MTKTIVAILTTVVLVASFSPGAFASDEQPMARIRDNSFLVEEAYNQEEGVVQNIQSYIYWSDRSWEYYFTQEWPVPDVTNQISYTIPVFDSGSSGEQVGIGDVMLNYRYQALLRSNMALAPRLSLILPTGSVDKGFGRDSVGIQAAIPYNIDMGRYWGATFNINGTFTPKSKYPVGARANAYDFYMGGNLIFLPHSNINFIVEAVYYNTDWYDSNNSRYRQQTVLISPSFRFAIRFKNGFEIVPGLAAPIGMGPSNGQYGLLAYLSIEGPFWKPKKELQKP